MNRIIKLLFWILERRYKFLYKDIDKGKVDDWLLNLSVDQGFRDYFQLRDYTLLKTIGQGMKENDYWMNVGRRIELLFMLGKAEEQKRLNDSKKKKGEIKEY